MGWATNLIPKLQAGETIVFNAPNGNSMRPRILPRQQCIVEPISCLPRVGDVVLCKVRGNQYLHLVSAIQGERVQISNNSGHVNGWITRSSIYGRLIDP
jgi:hypothetical protein